MTSNKEIFYLPFLYGITSGIGAKLYIFHDSPKISHLLFTDVFLFATAKTFQTLTIVTIVEYKGKRMILSSSLVLNLQIG